MVKYGGNKYLWGNVPSLNLLRLRDNEGISTKRDLSLPLAASGDPRNLVKTIVCLPEEYKGHVHVDEASLIILHLWYSAFLSGDLMESIQSKIAPLVKKVVKSKTARDYDNVEASWACNSATLSAELPGKTCSNLASYFPGKANVPFEKASAQRQSVTLAHSRRDYRDRAMLRLPPSWRLAKLRFRKEGVLLPFGASSERFKVPNPTLFQHQSAWPMADSADPLDGWESTEFMTEAHSAKQDIYDQLYFHVRNTLFKFCQKIATLDLEIRLVQMDAEELSKELSHQNNVRTYDRIELSNIADRAYLGPHKTVGLFSTFLRDRLENPSSTLLTLFLNVTHEVTTLADMVAGMETSIRDKTNAESMKLMQAQSLFVDNDALFGRFLQETRLEEFTKSFFGVAMKENNTIVSKWPMRLGKNPAQKEFDMVFQSGHQGSERYVEWRRTR
ncbi:DUF4470 domain-containing protein [Aspergillus glaucus CBS 516.65]|uniref:DUF4470 domain-containing protein n=1 Tax=Aspergillus glaucus CBS 516.65 TaxID=1160497 RepID=A0A1L9VQH7_ASPGL|nr:hypothetical protein ASPGLDRAFT_65329 [Aspergillus glaucus CBS 516.65]OJJ86188.1 hypothetical protein ASPGLDRAFT_65329 [Aspergillus glaucus CBS 516.65]